MSPVKKAKKPALKKKPTVAKKTTSVKKKKPTTKKVSKPSTKSIAKPKKMPHPIVSKERKIESLKVAKEPHQTKTESTRILKAPPQIKPESIRIPITQPKPKKIEHQSVLEEVRNALSHVREEAQKNIATEQELKHHQALELLKKRQAMQDIRNQHLAGLNRAKGFSGKMRQFGNRGK